MSLLSVLQYEGPCFLWKSFPVLWELSFLALLSFEPALCGEPVVLQALGLSNVPNFFN